MILVDPHLEPDLDPDPPPRSSASKSAVARNPARIPSIRSLANFLRQAQAAVGLRGQVSVLLTSDEAIRKLNRKFRGKNKETDVLSFPADTVGPEKIAGDLAISVPTALRQGTACGHSLGTELKVLMLHGLLHLAGYDHETDEGEMARRERKLRAKLGLPLGLIERAAAPALSPEKKRKDGARGMPRRPTKKATAGPLRQVQGRLSTPLRSAQDDRAKIKAGCPILSAASRGKGGKPQKSARRSSAGPRS